jgi:S1-C subfamily serine protease
MASESQTTDRASGTRDAQTNTVCPNCHAEMPLGMRFCRLCGYRLGEGVEEYTETVRLGNRPAGQASTSSAGNPQTTPFGVHDWGAMAPSHASQVAFGKKKRKGKGPHWIVWVILSVVLMSVMGGSFMGPFKFNIGSGGSSSRAQKARVGASDFENVDGGVMIESVKPSDGPFDKAGMIGGDIITSFDGQPVKSDRELRDKIGATPIGKPVEVLYTRDGEAKKTVLTTVSKDEMDRLSDIADGKPDGFLGVDDDQWERVQIPNSNLYGVKLGRVIKNNPAYTSGLRDGDIVIEFNGTPIRTPEELNERIDRATPDSVVTVIIIRGAERMEIKVFIGVGD